MNIFEEIKSRLDIREVYTYYTGRHIERHNKALCVFHRDTHPSMSFKGEIFKCFVCDKGGDVFKFMEYYLGLKGIEAARRLNDDFRLGLIQPTGRRDRRRELLERKRRVEHELQKQLKEEDERKNREVAEKVHNLNEGISLYNQMLSVEGLTNEACRWLKSEIKKREQKLDEIASAWEQKNKELICSITDVKKQLSEWLNEEKRRIEQVRKRIKARNGV